MAGQCPYSSAHVSRVMTGSTGRPRMGVSSLRSRPPMQVERSLPLGCPIPPRPASPPIMPRTAAGVSRSRRCQSPSLDRTLTPGTPGSADRTLGNTSVRLPDFTKYEPTVEELGKLEFVEMQNIEDDLRDFQMKRRKLVFNIASLNLSKAKKSIKKAVSKMQI